MRLPGFSGEMSLESTGRYYRRTLARGSQDVTAQLKGGGFHHRPFGGGVFTTEDYWTCKQGCEAAKSACLDTCEGTVVSPKPSKNCNLCDDAYATCMQGCTRDIA